MLGSVEVAVFRECQVKHFAGFCLVRHKLHVSVLAVGHQGNQGKYVSVGSLHLPGFAVRISQKKV